MYSNIEDCCRLRNGDEWCHLSDSCQGWGCRLLTVLPDKIPANEQERARLFSRVYLAADRIGVLACPHFKEMELDNIVEDSSKLTEMMETVRNAPVSRVKNY